jgi:uncharacterized membrane protein
VQVPIEKSGPSGHAYRMKISRIEGLADGIFSISMTLLVLDLHVPTSAGAVVSELHTLAPKLFSLVISFVILGVYWGAHHMLMSRLKEINYPFMWKNIYFFLPISLVPFSTSLLGAYPLSHSAQITYALDLALCGTLLFSLIHYSLLHEDFFSVHPTVEFKRNVATKTLLPVIAYVLAVPLTFVSPWAGLVALVIGPVVYFTPIDSKAWSFIVIPTERMYRFLVRSKA